MLETLSTIGLLGLKLVALLGAGLLVMTVIYTVWKLGDLLEALAVFVWAVAWRSKLTQVARGVLATSTPDDQVANVHRVADAFGLQLFGENGEYTAEALTIFAVLKEEVNG